MYLISYLAHDDTHIAAVQERMDLAAPPHVLVVARSVPELINQAQTLPLRAVIADITWPRADWTQFVATLRQARPDLPILALADASIDDPWWEYADELLRLDLPFDLFMFRLTQAADRATPQPDMAPPTPAALAAPVLPPAPGEPAGLLESPQFRKFAEIFSSMDEATLAEAFVGWVQQACQTSRAVLLLQDPRTGAYRLAAHRGLPSSLASHCQFAQTAPLCRWLATTGRILVKQSGTAIDDVTLGLELMQAAAAVPILFDGQLVGVLGVGPRLIGHSYNAVELEGLYALGGQVAVALHHCRLHQSIQRQQELTEHMLGVMPTGTIVLNDAKTIAFANTAAAAMVGKTRAQLQGLDLRALPSPLGDFAFEALMTRQDLPRREMEIGAARMPVAASALALPTTPPSALLLLEDLSAQRQLGVERERRVNLEVVTNLVHFLAHELRNPLVALSTFSSLVPTRATDPDFQEFCATVLQGEISRVNLLLEQLLVLTNHADFSFGPLALGPLVERVTHSDELQQRVVTSAPLSLPTLFGDAQRLETALTCMLRSVLRLARPETPATLQVKPLDDAVVISVEAPAQPDSVPPGVVAPWEQFLDRDEQPVDLGLATAHYIVEQHNGALTVAMTDLVLTVTCRLPLSAEASEEDTDDAEESSRRRR